MSLLESETICNEIGVYVIESPITNKSYYGSSKNVTKRLKIHERLLKSNKHPNSLLQKEFNKGHPLAVNAIVCKTREEAFKLEESFLNQYNGKSHLLNLTKKVVRCITSPSLESREKNRQAKLGIKHTKENREKLSNLLRQLKKETERPIIINGIKYESAKKASLILNIPRTTIFNRIKSYMFKNYSYA